MKNPLPALPSIPDDIPRRFTLLMRDEGKYVLLLRLGWSHLRVYAIPVAGAVFAEASIPGSGRPAVTAGLSGYSPPATDLHPCLIASSIICFAARSIGPRGPDAVHLRAGDPKLRKRPQAKWNWGPALSEGPRSSYRPRDEKGPAHLARRRQRYFNPLQSS